MDVEDAEGGMAGVEMDVGGERAMAVSILLYDNRVWSGWRVVLLRGYALSMPISWIRCEARW